MWAKFPGKGEWKRVVRDAVQRVENGSWCQAVENKSSLRVYGRIKNKLRREKYLMCERWKEETLF